MKVIFLDIDGVLNSDAYDHERDRTVQGNIDVTRLPLLRRIVEATGAKIVLTTSWRRHWDPDPRKLDDVGRELVEILGSVGLSVWDKTPDYDGYNRDCEVRDWLKAHEGEVEGFVILDDIRWGWGELNAHLVLTSPRLGRGLMESHVADALCILGGQ